MFVCLFVCLFVRLFVSVCLFCFVLFFSGNWGSISWYTEYLYRKEEERNSIPTQIVTLKFTQQKLNPTLKIPQQKKKKGKEKDKKKKKRKKKEKMFLFFLNVTDSSMHDLDCFSQYVHQFDGHRR